MKDLPVHYRYKDAVTEKGLMLVEYRFYPIRETECFYFILNEWQYKLYKRGVVKFEKDVKRVSKSGLRRKCYPSQAEALQSYKARKRSQLHHATDALNRAKLALKSLEEIEHPSLLKQSDLRDCRVLGFDEFINEYIFE